MKHISTSLCLILLAGSAARADTVSIVSVADNTLYQTELGSLSNGAGTAMFAGVNALPPTSIRRCVLRFAVASAIPPGSTVTSATLRLTQSASNADPQECTLHRLQNSWGEGASVAGSGQGGGGPAATNDATWVHRFWSATSWTTPGGDFVSNPSATTSVGEPGVYEWASPQVAADVQDMIDSPATDFGWILLGNEAFAQTSKKFSTREEPVLASRPTLVIEFASPCPGDLNGDGFVDDSDFVIFASGYNILDCADPTMPPGCPADLNGDGFADDADFVIFAAAYNELVCP